MTKANPAVVGAFVVGAIGLVVLGVVAFGTVQLFAVEVPVVMHFKGSVKGLSVGAPIDFRGVPVGEVTEIAGTVHSAGDDGELTISISVYGEIDPSSLKRGTDVAEPSKPGEGLVRLIEDGLRAQLETQSILTGQKFVALDFHPETPVFMHQDVRRYQEIPTIPSEFDVLKANFENLVAKIEKLPLEDLLATVTRTVERFGDTAIDAQGFLASVQNDATTLTASTDTTLADARAAITRVDAILADVQESGIVDNTNATVVDVGGLANNANEKIDVLTDQVKAAVASFESASVALQAALAQAKSTMATAEDVIEPDSELDRAVIATLNDIATAARDLSNTANSIRVLTDYLGQNPESVIFGKPAGGQ